MWNNQLPNNGNQPSRPSTSRPDGGAAGTNSPEYAAAAALARRMVYPGYDASALPPAAGSGYYDDSMWTHQQRQREMELMRLQRIQEQEAYVEEARRNRLLELELSVNQMQEYERAQIQLQMMRDMQHHEAGGRRLSGSVGAAGTQYAGMEANVRQQRIAEYLAGQRSKAVDDDAEAWRSSSSHSQRIPSGASSQQAGSQRAELTVATNEADLKMKSEPQKSSGATVAAAASSSPKRTKGTSVGTSPVNISVNGNGAVKKYSYPPPQPDSDANMMLDQKQPASPKKRPPDAENQTPSAEPVSSIAPAEKHASKTLAHLKAIQESHEAKDTTPSKATKKRRKSPAAKKTDSLASIPDKPSAGKGGKKKSPGGKAKLQSPRTMMNHLIKSKPGVPTVDDPVPPITESHYQNLDALMNEFCKVPLLAEFSRPVALLHPELMTLYSKIVHHPMDLGHVCRAIRRREYKSTRAIQLDMWRVFSNCVNFHTHPSNRDNAIPSFISIANHLRDFFNNLWQEFMMSSDAPPRKPGKGISHLHSAYQRRAEGRKERLVPISSTLLSANCMRKVADALESFITTGGKVDNRDKECILGDVNAATGDVATFIQSLRELIGVLEERIQTNQDYTVGSLQKDLKKTFTEDVFASEVLKRMRIGSRLDRLFWKIFVPVYEVNSRGVNQSSIWGNMAAVIWARESKKKPFWPAIVLGMMAPEFQKEDWHESLTLQNEGRLPEKLREELQLGKRRAEQALKKQTTEPMSYFLVEFMGTHEFIWVRESDIVETFDPEVDPNVAAAAGNVTKKRRSGHSSINPKLMSDAIEEGKWALEEFEILISDPCGDAANEVDEESEEYDEPGFTYDIMCQSDEEADALEATDKRKGNDSDIEELNELLSNNGCIDFSTEGRKKAKAKVAEMKKQKAALARQEKSKEAKAKKGSLVKKTDVTEVDTKQLAKLLEEDEKRAETRRKKRSRDHEKSLKDFEKQTKKSKHSSPDKRPHFIPEKKARAEAFVKSFLIHKNKALSDFHGAPFIPNTNSVDPSGLLGMALAFRGASGDIPFSNHKGKVFIENPWEKIDSAGPEESSQRCERLQEQINMIEKEIQKVNAATARRNTLSVTAKQSRDATHQNFIDAGEEIKASKKVFVSNSKKRKSGIKVEPVKSNGDIDNTACDRKSCEKSQLGDYATHEYDEATKVTSTTETHITETPSNVQSSTFVAPTKTFGDTEQSSNASDDELKVTGNSFHAAKCNVETATGIAATVGSINGSAGS